MKRAISWSTPFGAALGVFLLAMLPSMVWAQSAVQQGGTWTTGHVPKYNQTGGSQPMVTDGGGAGGGASGVNPATLGITARGTGAAPYDADGAGPNGENVCIYDGPTNSAAGYHSLCLDANIGSKATISTQAGGGATAQGLQFKIDGTDYDFPGDFPTIPVTVPNGGTGATTLTDTNLVIGNGTTAVTLLPPSATSGVPLISQGTGSDPAYGTAVVAGGGTGATTANAALNNLLPSQATHNGKVLATDGTNTAWTSVVGTGTVTSVATGAGLTGGPFTTSGTISFDTVADGAVLANITGGVAVPSANTFTAIMDDQIGTAQGSIAMRGAATWGALTPGTSGLPLLSAGAGADLVFGQLSITNLNIAGQTTGDMAYYDGAGWTRLAVGTSGQALSGGTTPTWQAINGTQIRMGSDAQGDILYFNGTNYARLGTGTAGQVLESGGAGANPSWETIASGPTQGTVQDTSSGTAFTFSSLPAGTTQIIMSMVSGSLSGTDNMLVQIGDSGGVETTGYVSSSISANIGAATDGADSTSGFVVKGGNAGFIANFTMTLNLVDAATNTWSAAHAGSLSTSRSISGGGSMSLSGVLDRIVLTRTGTNTFDAGKVNIQYQ